MPATCTHACMHGQLHVPGWAAPPPKAEHDDGFTLLGLQQADDFGQLCLQAGVPALSASAASSAVHPLAWVALMFGLSAHLWAAECSQTPHTGPSCAHVCTRLASLRVHAGSGALHAWELIGQHVRWVVRTRAAFSAALTAACPAAHGRVCMSMHYVKPHSDRASTCRRGPCRGRSPARLPSRCRWPQLPLQPSQRPCGLPPPAWP